MRPLFHAAMTAWTLLLFTLANAAFAAPPAPAIPEPLRPWMTWAKGDGQACSPFHGHPDLVRCAWPSKLVLQIDERGATFSQHWHLDAKEWVPLPGDKKRWPLDVRDGAKKPVTIEHAGAPSVELEPGDHVVTGLFAWDSMPESLPIPPETALIEMTLRKKRVNEPNRDAAGTVFLQKSEQQTEGDSLDLVVHRLLTDDVPLRLMTRISLQVAGKSREVLLGRSLPQGFVPMVLTSTLPTRVEPDSRLRVQVRPGNWTIELGARSDGQYPVLTRPVPDGPWRKGDEIWVFSAQNSLRAVTIEGAPAIDPQQTSLPDEWRKFPAYAMSPSAGLRLIERRRGDAETLPDQLSLTRQLWLDFDGEGYTISDVMSGTLSRATRLEMNAPTELGRVAIGSKDQFITKVMQGAALTGVEVRKGNLAVTADSRLPGARTEVPAVGWALDFHNVSATLHLPPGWRLLHASGVDEVPGTWLQHWTLLEVFLVLILSIATWRLFGLGWGALALIAFTVLFPEMGAPKWVWAFVLAFEAISRVVPKEGTVRLGAQVAKGASVVVLLLLAVPFLIGHVRGGFYPALEHENSELEFDPTRGMAKEANKGDSEVLRGSEEPAPPQDTKVPSPSSHAGLAPVGAENFETDSGGDDHAKRESAGKAQGPYSRLKSPPPPDLLRSPQFGAFSNASNGTGRVAQNIEIYDPNAMVQTGPGLPRWRWSDVALKWSGPVAQAQHLKLFLLSPRVNMALAFLRAALLIALILRFIPRALFRPRRLATAATLLLPFILTLSTTKPAYADMPGKDLLDELRAKLSPTPTCLPDCASSARMRIEAHPHALRVRIEFDAAASTAVPLPGSPAQWMPETIMVDGKAATALVRIQDTLWLQLSPGPHQVLLDGPIADRESVQLALHLKPHRVESSLDGWTLDGVHEDAIADDNLQLTRVHSAAPQAVPGASRVEPIQASSLPPFVRIERTISFGLTRQATTRIFRVTPPGTAIVLEVPLLPGEAVLTADIHVVAGKAEINMSPTTTEVEWKSALDERATSIVLAAPTTLSWVEVWRYDASPIWHIDAAGPPVVHSAASTTLPEWHPWPGEKLSLSVTRPSGVSGQTITIDSSTLTFTPGVRTTDAVLVLKIRASRGGDHIVKIPDGSRLESLAIAGKTVPPIQEGNKITLPLVPGQQEVRLAFHVPVGVATFYRAPAVDLSLPNINVGTTVVPGSRWVLLVHGPTLGPAVLFWSLFLVLLAIAIGLGRLNLPSVRTHEWFLLGIGLSQLDIAAAAVVVGWLLVLGWREAKADLGIWTFNLRQLTLIAWTFVAVIVLIVGVSHGLLGHPEMQIRGNSSSATSLQWFQDRAATTPDSPWVISVPMMAYRGAMLAWALWLAFALLRWLKWGWRAFGTGGFWKSPPPRPRPAPPMTREQWDAAQKTAQAAEPKVTPSAEP